MSSELRDYIRKVVKAQGPMPFSSFMELSLYHPESGYYRRGFFPGGGKGDFVTSPQASKFFGYLMAEQFIEISRKMDMKPLPILEIGAGSGIFAKDVLEYSIHAGRDDTFSYIIMEPYENLEAIQRDTLAGMTERVRWIKDFDDIEGFEGVIFSNELLDAFPVEVIEKRDGVFTRLCINVSEEGEFVEVFKEISDRDFLSYISFYGLDGLDDGYRTEINMRMKEWIAKIGEVLERGFVITVDYGYPGTLYFHPSRRRGTLLGYSAQRTTQDFYSSPGEIDITAHVNFTDLCRWGREAGLNPVGYTHQWAFLAGQDIEGVIGKFGLDPYSPFNVGLKMLLLPGGMGESHKVMVQSKGMGDEELSGFRLLNKIWELDCDEV